MEKISNDFLEVEVSAVGAEMHSLRDVETGRECLWNGDARYWNRHAPLLFPIVGGLWNGVCRIGGQEIGIPKHGFLREKEWTLTSRAADALTYACESGDRERAMFPFDFRVSVSYRLVGRGVEVDFSVENTGADRLWFQMGGHPGFTLPDFDEENPVSGYARLVGEADDMLRVGAQGCTQTERFPIPRDEQGRIVLSRETFEQEALIVDGGRLRGVELLCRDGSRLLTVESDAPVWLIWAPTGKHAPFVCIEPWYGLCDEVGFEGDVSRRPYVNSLAPGEVWRGGFRIRL